MTTDNIRTLVQYRLKQAEETLRASALLMEHSLGGVMNRSYYAMFYAALALLVLRQLETSKHSGAINLFDREFVHTGVFPRELSRWLHQAFRQRLAADYAPLNTVTEDEARQVLDQANAFVAQVKAHLVQELQL
jgi:uncharacterized protein (UPF0332 family)